MIKKSNLSNKKVGIVAIVFILILTLSISTLNVLEVSQSQVIFNVLRSTLELLYFFSGIAVVFGLFIAYKQLTIMSSDMKLNYERMALEKGQEYLGVFASAILPNINEFYRNIKDDPPIILNNWIPENNDYIISIEGIGELLNNNDKEREILKKLIIREENGITNIFNTLESFSSAVIYGLVKEEVVFQSIGFVFCRFINEEIISFCVARNDAPYENLCKLYKSWDAKIKSNSHQSKIDELTSIIKDEARKKAQVSSSILDNKHLGG